MQKHLWNPYNNALEFVSKISFFFFYFCQSEADRLERELDQFDLTPEEKEEKEELTNEGFASWTRRDFKIFRDVRKHFFKPFFFFFNLNFS